MPSWSDIGASTGLALALAVAIVLALAVVERWLSRRERAEFESAEPPADRQTSRPAPPGKDNRL